MNLDPKVRQKLLKESKTPFLGLRRLIWAALLGSASLGLIIMLTRVFGGETVPLSDFGVQAVALFLFGGLIYFDRSEGT